MRAGVLRTGRRRSHHAYQKRQHKKIFRPPQYKKKVKWPIIKVKEILRDAGVFMVCEDHVTLTRKELMNFYFRVRISQKKLENELTSKHL